MTTILKSVWGIISSPFKQSKSNTETENKEPAKTLPPVNLQPNANILEGQKLFQRLADAVKEKSSMLEPQTGPLSVYKIPLNIEQINITGCRRFSFGKTSFKHSRTIMVLGATGAGKSTLINGMINYILDVEWKNSYRFKLVNEDQSKSQAESQTSEVTVYKINHQEGFKIPFSLTIVDTPGFGDTRGIERDKEITEQLRNLFSAELGVSEIDAVCFVAQAALARLTPSQKYVFDSVLSIFGKDVAENIRVLVTFADGQRSPVLEAINASGVPCPKTKDGLPVHFKFNNSALFADNKSAADSKSEDDEDEGFDQMFWKMGTKSMKKFFLALNVIETKSLKMTQEVLRERKQLENSVENLQKQVKVGLAKLEEIKETSEQLKEHEAEIIRNENFEFEVTVTKPVQIDISGTGCYLTNCQQCHHTCHYPCGIPNDADKAGCLAMGSDGYCTVCPGKCYWNVHFNQKYKWEYKEVKEKRTVKELREKYLKAADAKRPVEALIDKLKAEYDEVQTEVNKLIERSAQCLNRLKEIALKPNPLSTPEYIDMIIEGEKSEGRPGWKKRVQSLMAMREKAEYMAKVARGETFLQSPSTDLQHCNQGQTKNSKLDTNLDQKQDMTDFVKGQDSKLDTNPDEDQDKTDSDSDKGQDSKLDTNPDEDQDKTDSDSDKGQDSKLDTKPDEDQDKTDSDSDKGQDSELDTKPDEDQDKTHSDSDKDEDRAYATSQQD